MRFIGVGKSRGSSVVTKIADNDDVEQLTKPLFRLDPGWLFIVAGLVVCAAGVLLPAQNDLQALQRQCEQLKSEELQAYDRLKAHASFIDQIDRGDPALVKRLAAAQLNMVPHGDTPLVVVRSSGSLLTDWIEDTVHKDLRPPRVASVSTLSRLANGPYRLWMFGGGIMAVFIGLMISPAPALVRRSRPTAVIEPKAIRSALRESHEATHAITIVESGDHGTPLLDAHDSVVELKPKEGIDVSPATMSANDVADHATPDSQPRSHAALEERNPDHSTCADHVISPATYETTATARLDGGVPVDSAADDVPGTANQESLFALPDSPAIETALENRIEAPNAEDADLAVESPDSVVHETKSSAG